ncbi:MAG: T9SS type A sorting domain-containing protein [Bacteroidetes bacterium]|nr:T9SS type A sorting domain-containing protein [Bacteroidota bacterium]
MKKTILSFLAVILWSSYAFATAYTWNGSTSTDWATAANWTPNGVPGAIDDVTIVTGGNNCLLPASQAINNLTITSGVLNLGGNTLTVNSNVNANGGQCNNGTLSATGATQTFAGTTFGANVNVSPAAANMVYFNGGIFNGSLTVVQNSASNTASSGGCTFNGTTSITNSGAGYLLLTSTAAKTDIFNGAVTFNTTGSSNLYVGYNGSLIFNTTPTVNNTSAVNTVSFGGGSGTVSLAAGVGINCMAFSSGGNFNINKLSQADATALNINVGNTGGVKVFNSTFTGALTITAGDILVQTSTYNAATILNKKGGSNNPSSGGNVFNGTLTMNHSGSGYFGMGNGTADIFNSDVFLNNTSNNERIIIGLNSTNNQLNGNVTVTQSGSAMGIGLGWGGTFPVVKVAVGKNIFIGGAGFTTGYLRFYAFAQSDASAISLTTTANSSIITTGSCVFTGNVTFTAPDIYIQGATFNAPATFNKTGGTYNHNAGNLNTFNSTCTINQQSSSGYFMLGYNSNDAFNDNIIVSNTGASNINIGWPTGSGQPTLANGKTLTVGGAGFASGMLQLCGFQAGTSPVNLTLTGTAGFLASKNLTGPCLFNGAVNITSPDIYIQGGTFNAPATFNKTGGTSNHNAGNLNTFNSTCTINQQSTSTGYFMLGYNSADAFNDNIVVTNASSQGINLSWSNGTGNPTLAAGKTILVGGAGFATGSLRLGYGFTQLGSAAINLSLGTAATLVFDSATIGGAVTSTSGSLFLGKSLFKSTLTATKTGSNNDLSYGGNTFQGVFSLTNGGTNYVALGATKPDVWNADATFNNTGSSIIYPADNSVGNQFNGNIIFTSSSTAGGIFFGANPVATATQAAGYNLSIGGTGYNGGYLILQQFTQLGNVASTLNFASTANYLRFGPSSTFGGNITSSTPGLYFNGATFNGTVNSTKTGSSSDVSTGNNVFNGVSSLTNNGSGYLLLGATNPDTWNADVTFNNTGTNYIYPAYNSAGNKFNGNIIFNSSSTALGIYFGSQPVATATQAAGYNLSIGGTGYNGGYLLLKSFTQLGNVASTLNFASTANYLQFGPSSTFGGNITSNTPGLYFNGATFNGTVNSTKTGSTNDQSLGGNTFNGRSVVTNTGSGYLLLGFGNPDVFNKPTIFNNTGTYRFFYAYSHAGQTTRFADSLVMNSNKSGGADGWSFFVCDGANNSSVLYGGPVVYNVLGPVQSYCRTLNAGTGCTATYNSNLIINMPNTGNSQIQMGTFGTSTYNGNIVVSNTGSGAAGGVYFNTTTSATSTLANGQTISIGASGFNMGVLSLIRFTQIGGTAQSLTLTGTGNLTVGPTSAFGGNVTFTSPTLFLNGATYSGTGNFTKNGSTSDQSLGGNIFTGVSSITNSGSGNIYMASQVTTPDNFIGDATALNSGSGLLVLAYNSPGNTFGNLTCNNTASSAVGTYLSIAQTANATAALSGNLIMNNTGIASAAAAYSDLYIAYNGTITVNGTTNITNNGSGAGHSRVFIGENSGAIPSSTFNGDATFSNIATVTSGDVYIRNVRGTLTFNGNVIVNSTANTPSGFNGIYFCWAYPTYTGIASLASGKTISVGSSGFSKGELRLLNFTQNGSTPQSLTLTGTAKLTSGPNSAFGGNVTFTSPTMFLNGATYSGTGSFTKNGNTNDNSIGGNTFTGANSFINAAPTAQFILAGTNPDTYIGNSSFTQTAAAGVLYPNYNSNCTYAGNITVSAPVGTTMLFGGAAAGVATMNGTAAQTINLTSGNIPQFTRFVMNHTGPGVTLNTPINISTSLTMNDGLLNTTTTNIPTLFNGCTASSAVFSDASTSYINGPMRYQKSIAGITTLNLPVGKGADSRPAVLTVNHTNGTLYNYIAEVFNADAWTAAGSTMASQMPPTVDTISKVHYWKIDRTDASAVNQPTLGLNGSQQIQLFFGPNDYVYQGANLTVVKTTTVAAKWIDIGGTCALGNFSTPQSGNVTSTSSPSTFNSFSLFTLGSKYAGWNPLPIELLTFTATPAGNNVNVTWSTATEVNNNYFTVEHSADGVHFEFVAQVKGAGNSTTTKSYNTVDTNPYQGTSYYRLTQTDYNGDFKTFPIVSVTMPVKTQQILVYPNPSSNNSNVMVELQGYKDVNTSIKVYSGLGVELLSKNITPSAAIGYCNLNEMSTLPKGVYYINVISGDKNTNIKVVIE